LPYRPETETDGEVRVRPSPGLVTTLVIICIFFLQ
jgi:hypothetical protein